MEKIRLDDWLVQQGHYPSRARARDAVKRGCVTFEDGVSAKPSRTVTDPNLIRISDPAMKFVSRAALKLEAALEHTGYSPDGLIALDLGASTGGFSQILAQRGASHIYAVDVGHDQLDPAVAALKNITNLEKLNARHLTIENLEGNSPQFITSDLSFISLRIALPPALNMAAPGAIGIFLVKPQFEVGKENLGRGGIVRDIETSRRCADELYNWLDAQPGWRATHLAPSPIAGGDGNKEYLMAGIKNADH